VSIELGFFETRVARRLFLRFVMCAVLPMGVLAGLSFATVTANLRERGDLRLSEVATATERSVRDRLDRARDDLALLVGVVEADELTRPVGPWNEPRAAASLAEASGLSRIRDRLLDLPRPAGFESLVVATPGGGTEAVFGRSPAVPTIGELDLRHLRSGKALLVEVEADPKQIWMGRALSIGGERETLLWAELDPVHLWATSTELARRGDFGELYVLNAQFGEVYRHGLPDQAITDDVVRSATRSIFLRDEYSAGTWYVVANVSERAVMAPMRGFAFTFLPLALLVLLGLVLWSIAHIRRTIEPLLRLQAATQRIGAEDFGARIDVSTAGEFQDLAVSFNTMAANLGRRFQTLTALRQLDRVGLEATTRREIVDTLLQTLLTVQASETVSVCTFGTTPGEETVSHAVIRVDPEVTIVHRFDCAPWELEDFEGQEHVLLDVESSRESLPCFLRVPPFNDLEHKRFLILPVDPSVLSRGLVCFASPRVDAFAPDEVRRARHLTDQAARAFSNVNRMEDLSHLNVGALRALARSVDASSPWTAGHSERVARVAVALGQRLGLDDAQLDTLRRAGLVHDIGKIGVPLDVVNKPSALTDEEFERVKEHVTVGARFLEPVEAYSDLVPIVLHHHERMDGHGYPSGLEGEAIPYLARIMAVADTFDALTSDRPYRSGLPFRTAVEVVRNASGSQLDEHVVEAFMELVEEDGVDLDFLNEDTDTTIDFVWDEPGGDDAAKGTPTHEPPDERREPEGEPSPSGNRTATRSGPRVAVTL